MARFRLSVTWPMGSEVRAILERIGAQDTGPTELVRTHAARAARVVGGDAILPGGALAERAHARHLASLDLDTPALVSHVGAAARDGRRPPHLVTPEAWRTT